MPLAGNVKLGDRLFTVVIYPSITALNEHYIMKLLRATGLDAVLPIGVESNQEYLLRVHASVVDTLRLHELLAGFLLPMGKTESDWDLEMAKATAAHIAGLTEVEDKAEVHKLGLDCVFLFFSAALASLKHSQNVLNSLGTGADKSNVQNQSHAAH